MKKKKKNISWLVKNTCLCLCQIAKITGLNKSQLSNLSISNWTSLSRSESFLSNIWSWCFKSDETLLLFSNQSNGKEVKVELDQFLASEFKHFSDLFAPSNLCNFCILQFGNYTPHRSLRRLGKKLACSGTILGLVVPGSGLIYFELKCWPTSLSLGPFEL